MASWGVVKKLSINYYNRGIYLSFKLLSLSIHADHEVLVPLKEFGDK